MQLSDNLIYFDSVVQKLDDEQLIKLQAKLHAGSNRYVKIEILNGNIETFSELNSTATLVEDVKRKAGEASENVYDKKKCSELMAKRVSQAENNLTRLTSMLSGFFNFGPHRGKSINSPEELREIANDFKEKYEASYGKLCGKAVFERKWEIDFRSDGIEIKQVAEEQAIEEEKLPAEQNPLHAFLAFNKQLKWTEEGGLQVDPAGSQADTIKALHQALFSKSPYRLDDLCEDFLMRVQGERGNAADEISSHFIHEWLGDYLREHPEDKEVATQFVKTTFQLTKSYGRQKFLKTLDAFLKMVHVADTTLKPALITFSDYFIQDDDNLLLSVVELNSPILNNCLQRIAKQGGYTLGNWLNLYDKPLSFSELQKFSKSLPDEWLFEKLKLYLVFGPQEKLLSALRNSSNFTAFYYLLKTGEPYEGQSWEQRFPLEAKGDRYSVKKLANVGYGDQNNYGALFHQTLQIGLAALKEKKWDFPQLLALLMLRRNQIAQIQEKHGQKIWFMEASGNLTLGHEGHITPCSGSYQELGEVFRSSLSQFEKWKGFVTKVDEQAYQLHGTLNGKTFAHSRIKINADNVYIHHTSDLNTRLGILSEVEQLFNQARLEDNREAFMKKIALIYYWICQAKPFELGDPSIAEMVIRILCMEKGIELTSWKDDIIPWAEVMKHFDPEEFANKFPSFFNEA